VVALFVAVFVVGAIKMQFETVNRAALVEAEHVAEMIGLTTIEYGFSNPAQLKDYVARLAKMRKRDVVIVDTSKRGLADADEDEVGRIYNHDPDDEVGKTIKDGQSRTFVEKNEFHIDGAHQIVIPLRQRGVDLSNTTIGAVILEYTAIRDELFAAEREHLYVITGAGAMVVILATLFGVGIARRIAQPLHDLKSSVERIATEDYKTRVVVTSQDEIGLLGVAFNKMAEHLSLSHTELVKHRHQLEERIAERTEDLRRSNASLQQEARDHKHAVDQVEYLAYYDSLTALPNRSLFSKLLNQCITESSRYGKQLAVLFVDLDRFKNINDTLGHAAGDLLLQEVGRRLKSCLRESDVVARMGGDEFVVLLPNIDSAADVATVAHKILTATSKSFATQGQKFHVTASIGICIYPGCGDDERSLMQNADIAMYQAKEEGKNNFQFYSEAMNPHSFERLALESSLRRALEQGEFELHYQPKIDLRSNRIVGMEALLRWNHPELGMVAPAKFIPIAEETGLIVSIGKWVLRTACAQNVAWQKKGLPHLSMAVNLSAREFLDEHLLSGISSILNETGMSPALLELEITESMLMHDIDKATRILQDLRDMGVRLAVDDFGTGYSSLSNLKRFPINTIKVDRSFIRDLPTDSENRGITEAIIAMSRALRLTVVAEGVETKEQADYLREHACDECQGFYFSKGVSANEFAKLLESQMPVSAHEDSLILA
jgi:diguanylate cyclase (GGDEF)-like protein